MYGIVGSSLRLANNAHRSALLTGRIRENFLYHAQIRRFLV
jgi:hypothetical protein